MVSKFLLTTTAGIALAGTVLLVLPEMARGVVDRASSSICSLMPKECLEAERRKLQDTQQDLRTGRDRVEDGLGSVEAHSKELTRKLDGLKANMTLFASREADRMARGGATLDFAGRTYLVANGDIVAQAKLWTEQQRLFEQLQDEVSGRRRQFVEARQTLALAGSKVEAALMNVDADIALGDIARTLAGAQKLLVQGRDARGQARVVLENLPSPAVRPIEDVLGSATVPRATQIASSGGIPSAVTGGFDMAEFLRRNGQAAAAPATPEKIRE